MLSDEEKTNLIAQYSFGSQINALALVAEVERAVLAKASQQVRGEQFGNTGHGHVWERPDGLKARCGGVQLCSQCKSDEALFKSAKAMPAPKQEPLTWPDLWQDKLELAHMKGQSFAGIDPSFSAAQECAIKMISVLAPPQAAAIPEGWRLVPIEVTREQALEMIKAGAKLNGVNTDVEVTKPELESAFIFANAMLSAAPKPEGE